MIFITRIFSRLHADFAAAEAIRQARRLSERIGRPGDTLRYFARRYISIAKTYGVQLVPTGSANAEKFYACASTFPSKARAQESAYARRIRRCRL